MNLRPPDSRSRYYPGAGSPIALQGQDPIMIDKLEFIIALAREQHFGRAAEVCGVSRS